ncbi:hypothetical protein [Pyrococcus sp. ST04]|uniref:hypothetical protein n=1 Tax=Pyrococcus sp. ST04 TaxID=1183377 RepID=UPI0011D18CE3|nr:hypothetical protein [Pyrococcus sp. ST04]
MKTSVEKSEGTDVSLHDPLEEILNVWERLVEADKVRVIGEFNTSTLNFEWIDVVGEDYSREDVVLEEGDLISFSLQIPKPFVPEDALISILSRIAKNPIKFSSSASTLEFFLSSNFDSAFSIYSLLLRKEVVFEGLLKGPIYLIKILSQIPGEFYVSGISPSGKYVRMFIENGSVKFLRNDKILSWAVFKAWRV